MMRRFSRMWRVVVSCLAVCLVAARWLWPQHLAERLSGVLLVALGANSFVYVALGDAGLRPQVSVATVLRVTLGMCLLYAWKIRNTFVMLMITLIAFKAL